MTRDFRLLGYCPNCRQPLYIAFYYRPNRRPHLFKAEQMLIAGAHTRYIKQKFNLTKHQMAGILWRWKDKLEKHARKHSKECKANVERPRPYDPGAKWR